MEYYCETLKEVTYRGNKGYLWKMDYAKFYLDNFPNLRLLKKELLPIKVEQERGNVEACFCWKNITKMIKSYMKNSKKVCFQENQF